MVGLTLGVSSERTSNVMNHNVDRNHLTELTEQFSASEAESSDIERNFERALLRGDAKTLQNLCPISALMVSGNFALALNSPVGIAALSNEPLNFSPRSIYTTGVACLLEFIRHNYAGPRTSHNRTASERESDELVAHSLALDGEDVVLNVRMPHLLVAARKLLVENLFVLCDAGAELAPWWATRVVLAHNAVLSAPTPTLKNELFTLFARFLGHSAARTLFSSSENPTISSSLQSNKVDDTDDDVDDLFAGLENTVDEEDEMRCVLPHADEPTEIALTVLAYLELALAQRLFYDPEAASESILRAAQYAQIEISVKGELGTRTKYQQNPTAQLIARARRVLHEDGRCVERYLLTGLAVAFPGDTRDNINVCAELPLPKNVAVNDSDALGFIKLTDQSTELDSAEIEHLTPLDQALVLAYASVTRASNAEHLLTDQQMAPYVNLVLKNETSLYGASSLVQMKALVMRVSFENERGRLLERCMTQMEVVNNFIDDDMCQLSDNVRSAAVAERAYFTFAAGVQPWWEMKKQLAIALGKIGLVKAAMDIFLELEFWDELVDCHRLLGNIGAAEELIMQQLEALDKAVEIADPKLVEKAEMARKARRPRLLCVLGDVTRNTSHFETAWEESGHRYTRAKRALGRFYVDTQKWTEAMIHLGEALALNPLYPDVWFAYGCTALETKDYNAAAHGFTQVVRQTPNFAEGWNNLARALVELNKKKEALTALMEAGRLMRESWRVWDNVLTLATETKSTNEALRAIDKLLELRERDANISRPLIVAVESVVRGAQSKDKDERVIASSQCRQLLKILGRATSTVSTNAEVWEAYARVHELVPGTEGMRKAFDCRLKQARAIKVDETWKRDVKAFRRMVVATTALCDTAKSVGEETVLKNAMQHVKSVMEQTVDDFKEDAGYLRLEQLVKELS